MLNDPQKDKYTDPEKHYVRVVPFLGISITDISGIQIAKEAAAAAMIGSRRLILNVNAHMAMLARREQWLLAKLNSADITFCDGAGVQFGIWLLTGRLPDRTTPPEWVGELASRLPAGASIFWVGGAPGVVEAAASRFAERYGVKIAGTQHGFFDHRSGSDDNRLLLQRINEASPDVILVNMGMPLQERWLTDHWTSINARIGIVGGALVDHWAGSASRPPRWVANLGLEWLVRLAREPRRLWRRYLFGLPPFVAIVVAERLRMARHRHLNPRARRT